jgi:hypothetical protein
MKKKRSRVARRRLHLILIGIAVAAAAFFGLFYTTDMEISGNSRYTDEQIRSMIQSDPLSWNTVLMSLLHRTVHVDAPLISSIQVSFVTRNRLRITVNEKYPIGYLQLDGTNYYFDKDGVVIETTSSDGSSVGGTDTSSSFSSSSAQPSEAAEQQTVSGSSSQQAEITAVTPEPAVAGSQEESATEADTGNGSESYAPALSDVPLIEGLGAAQAAEGEKLAVKDDSVFTQILALTKLIDKFDIPPDKVVLDESLNMTLYYGDVRINLGSDDYLEEKMTRAAAILPQLGGMSGELHLENYSSDTQNIIFDSDSTQQ